MDNQTLSTAIGIAKQFAKAAKPTDEQVATAVTEWLDDNVDPVGSAVVVDKSLSIIGAAADAAKVGEFKKALTDSEDAIMDMQFLPVRTTWEYGSIDTSGNNANNNRQDFARTNGYFEPTGNYLRVTRIENESNTSGNIVVCEYNSSNVLVTRTVYNRTTNPTMVDFDIPLNQSNKYRIFFSTEPALSNTINLNSIDNYFIIRILNLHCKLGETNKPYNIFDGKYSDGFIGTNGTITASDSYVYSTDYIPVTPGDELTWWVYSNHVMTTTTVRFVCAYNAGKTAVSASGANSSTHSYTVPAGIAYIRFTYSNNDGKSGVMCVVNESDTPAAYEAYYEPYYGFSENVDAHYAIRKKVNIYAADGIEGFYAKMQSAFALTDCDVHIEKGTYTFSNAIIDSIRGPGFRGIPIGNGCRYYFNGAKLYCEYTGTNASDVVNYFSPLDSQSISSDFEIYNLDLVAKNVCYAIHDEANGGSFCRHIYEDCNVELDNTSLGTESGNYISKALGGGLAAYEEVIIRNCVFKATNPAKTSTYQNDASYHGANNSEFTDAKIVVDGCYFENIFRCSNLEDNTSSPFPRIIYTNNSCSGRNVDLPGNWKVYAWNNELRT